MGKKKSSSSAETTSGQQTPSQSSTTASSPNLPPTSSKASNGSCNAPQPQQSVLNISRNKHWRFISAFHGPWLQLPPELLETLAHGNYLAPRPRQTEPGVLYDLIKIRKLVDEASNLAVRAQNGTASSALREADNGMPGSSLGLTHGNGGGNAKLSPERKYRMRELATQKLAQAYRLDEIAASVATMQSASSLDSVAGLVLQRNPKNMDAKYVHFFHEKIPSRMVAESTPLTPLNEIIAHNPGIAATFRTKGLTNIFKEDYLGAIKDFTEALAICRLDQQKHSAGKNQLVTAEDARVAAERRKTWSKDWLQENKVAEDDQPHGIEMQLLFQRGNQHLTVASQYMKIALDHFRLAKNCSKASNDPSIKEHDNDSSTVNGTDALYRKGIEARDTLRKHAKRALKDYTTFLSHLDYAHALPHQAHDDLFRRNRLPDGLENRVIEELDEFGFETTSSQALVRRPSRSQHRHESTEIPSPPPPAISVHDIASVLSSAPPSNLPVFPFASGNPHQQELITYHPLMLETMHSLLLAHCILQTPPTSLHRHAVNAARLVRLADGYPFFLAARSPARSDWTEILRKLDNWIGLPNSWDNLCSPPNANKANSSSPSKTTNASSSEGSKPTSLTIAKAASKPSQEGPLQESSEQRANRIHKEAVMDALGDERVVDDESFQRSVQARERRAWRDIEKDHGAIKEDPNLKTSADSSHDGAALGLVKHQKAAGGVAKDEEYLIGTERANTIVQWIMEAPSIADAPSLRPKKGKKKARPKETDEHIKAVSDHVRAEVVVS